LTDITKWIELAYLLGWIEMLDSYQRAQGVDEKQRFVKKQFVTAHAINIVMPNSDPAEVNAFLKELGEMKPEEALITLMQKKIDRDNMMKVINESKFADTIGARKFGI